MIEKNVDVDSDGVITCMASVKFPSFTYCQPYIVSVSLLFVFPLLSCGNIR
jgi:hypothetical protein